MGAQFRRHASKQDIQTPPEFFRAIQRKFRVDSFALDAAASGDNAAAPEFYSLEKSGLAHPWKTWTWCNPPYGDIEPWVKKAHHECELGVSSMILVPASVGSNWWRDWVHHKGHAILLNGRITFVGQPTPYPKDLALIIYTPYCQGSYDVWTWQL